MNLREESSSVRGKSEEIPQPAAVLQPSRPMHVNNVSHLREWGLVFGFAHVECIRVGRQRLRGRTASEDFALAGFAFAARKGEVSRPFSQLEF